MSERETFWSVAHYELVGERRCIALQLNIITVNKSKGFCNYLLLDDFNYRV